MGIFVSGSYSNFHQSTLNAWFSLLLKTKYKSCTSDAFLTGNDRVFHFCMPPVFGTGQFPTCGPFVLSKCSSMIPPSVVEATEAAKDFAPWRKSTPFTLM